MGREDGLGDAEVGEEFHLREALEGGFARVGHGPAMRHGGDVAVGEAGVVVGGADEAVEIHFVGGHGKKGK